MYGVKSNVTMIAKICDPEKQARLVVSRTALFFFFSIHGCSFPFVIVDSNIHVLNGLVCLFGREVFACIHRGGGGEALLFLENRHFQIPRFKKKDPFSSFFLEKQHFQTPKPEMRFTCCIEKKDPFYMFFCSRMCTPVYMSGPLGIHCYQVCWITLDNVFNHDWSIDINKT